MFPKAYQFRCPPWAHQRQALTASWEAEAFALFMEQGTGKTKVIIDNAGMLYASGKIDALVVVAPDGVQRAWVRDQLPAHAGVPYAAAWWENNPTKALAHRIDHMAGRDFKGLRVLTVNYELLLTKEAFKWVQSFLRAYRCLLAADESHRIKNHKAKSSHRMQTLADSAPYRRVLTGTPISTSPLDIYSQFLYLDPKILGYRSYVAFKADHAELVPTDDYLMQHIIRRLKTKYRTDAIDPRKLPQLIRRDPVTNQPLYRNVDRLAARIKPFTFRALKADCMDLPPKVYQKRYVTLNPAQRRIYNELREDFFTEYAGKLMATPLTLTRLTRLQQITGGFFTPDADTDPIAIEGENPKLTSLLDVVEQAGGKLLIWARFKPELRLIANTLAETYGEYSVARYWGDESSKAKRDKNKLRFVTDPACKYFVAQQKAGGTGLDGLQVADTVLFFSNELGLIDRSQPEDRAHRGGSEIHKSVTIIDLVAEDTLDNKWIDSLRNQKSIADAITGDDPKEWL